MKHNLLKRALSVLICVVMIMSICTVTFTAHAADEITVYFKNTGNWGNVNAYYWIKASNSGPVQWPGVAMTNEGEGVYSIKVPTTCDMIIFNNGSTQTDDLPIPSGNQIYDFSAKKWDVYDTSTVTPIIKASKADGGSFRTETLDVTYTVLYADSASYSVDGSSSVSFTDSTTVTVGQNLTPGATTTVTVTATNANGTTSETFTYLKKDVSAVDGDGSTAPALSGYYGTNPDNQVGKQASITIDGSISDWDSSMLIAQGVANDDPRVYCNSSMHEIAVDDYALYAAWDSDNLYLMWEMANVQDSVAPADDFPLSQGNLWIYNLPIFLYFSIDPTIEGDGSTTTDATIWNSGITFDANIDTVVACSTNASNGPFVYKSNDDGKIVYNDTTISSINIEWGNDSISQNLYGIDKGHGQYNNRTPGDTLLDTSKWVDFYESGMKHSKDLDMFYEMSIPLDVLGTSAAEIENSGIGLMKVSTFGTSAMNTLPADPSTWDNATKEYSNDPSTSQEKEDADHITVPLARIGKMGTSSGTTPTPPTPTTPTTPVDPTTPSVNPTTPTQDIPDTSGGYLLGDADKSDDITIIDATTIQRFLAKLITEENLNMYASDVDADGEITILDATNIQRHLAKLPIDYPIGQRVSAD